MSVAELIAKLQTMPQNATVLCVVDEIVAKINSVDVGSDYVEDGITYTNGDLADYVVFELVDTFGTLHMDDDES